MFESSLSMAIAEWALTNNRDMDYYKDWAALKKHFKMPRLCLFLLRFVTGKFKLNSDLKVEVTFD